MPGGPADISTMTTKRSRAARSAAGLFLALALGMALAGLSADATRAGAWVPAALAAGLGVVFLLLRGVPAAVTATIAPVGAGLVLWSSLTVEPDGALLFLYVLPVVWAAFSLPLMGAALAAASASAALGVATVRDVPSGAVWVTGTAVMLMATAMIRILRGRIRELEHLDHVTGLPNARAWAKALERETHRALRHEYPITLVLLDLDGFGEVNRRQGHDAGDRLLRSVAVALSDSVRGTDVVARLAADTYGVLLVGTRSKGAAATVRRLRGAVPEDATFSAAVVPWDGHESTEDLMRLAHRTLAAAVSEGPEGEKVAPVLERVLEGSAPRADQRG